jgi:hypothetical protein
MASASAAVHVGRTANGCCIRVEGRGTMKESPAVQEFVARTLDLDAAAKPGEPACGGAVAVDLSRCDYLDSTFLGCLLGLYKQYGGRGAREGSPVGGAGRGRFTVTAPPEKLAKLFGPTRLDKLMSAQKDPPQVTGEWVPLAVTQPVLDRRELTQHVMECHRQLAEVESPQQAAFRRIADQLERELEAPA